MSPFHRRRCSRLRKRWGAADAQAVSTMKQRFRILLFLLLLVTVIFIGGVALGMSEGFVSSKPAYQDPPLYPHAQELTVEKPPNGVERFTRFSTADTPIRVLAFYADALPRGGWEFDEAYDEGV